MPEKGEKRIHIRTPGREGTTLIINSPEKARKVRRDILRRDSTQDTGNRRKNPQPEKGSRR